MGRLLSLYRLTVVKKFVMAVTGLILFGFIIGHLLGNLKVFMGPEIFNHYAEGLRNLGDPLLAHEQALWLARVGLLLAVGLHISAALELRRISREARPVAYQKKELISFSPASHYMWSGGLTIAAFIVYHLLHLTFGVAHHDFQTVTVDGRVMADAYHNVIAGFQVWWVTLVYLIAQVALGMHLYHGLWSASQTLGINHPKYNHLRRTVALAIAWLICLGYASIPIAVLTGLVS